MFSGDCCQSTCVSGINPPAGATGPGYYCGTSGYSCVSPASQDLLNGGQGSPCNVQGLTLVSSIDKNGNVISGSSQWNSGYAGMGVSEGHLQHNSVL